VRVPPRVPSARGPSGRCRPHVKPHEATTVDGRRAPSHCGPQQRERDRTTRTTAAAFAAGVARKSKAVHTPVHRRTRMSRYVPSVYQWTARACGRSSGTRCAPYATVRRVRPCPTNACRRPRVASPPPLTPTSSPLDNRLSSVRIPPARTAAGCGGQRAPHAAHAELPACRQRSRDVSPHPCSELEQAGDVLSSGEHAHAPLHVEDRQFGRLYP